MLQRVEVVPGHRQELRRAVSLEADLITERWERPRRHRVIDLSPRGMCVAAGTRLEPGERLVVSFTPPGWWVLGELELFARVRRSVPRHGERPATVGLEFLDLPWGARGQLDHQLRGLPPPLPQQRPRTELVWVDELVTWEEDLGDRVNTFEVSAALMPIFDGMIEPRALSAVLTTPPKKAA